MSYFKKFTDFCAGVAAFAALLLLIRKYMSFKVDTELLAEKSKLVQFLEDKTFDAVMYIHLFFILFFTLILGIIFRKLPYICLIFSMIPIVYVGFMIEKSIISEQVALFLSASALQCAGNLAECIFRDKEDGRHRLFIASKIALVLSADYCFSYAYLLNNPPTDIQNPNTFENEFIIHENPLSAKELIILGIMFSAVFLIGLLLYNVYFADAILSLIPLGYAFLSVTFERLTLAPLVFLIFALICASANILLALCENNLSYKEQNKKER